MVDVALSSFTRLLHCHGKGMNENLITTVWSYCNLLSITLNTLDMPVTQDSIHHTSHPVQTHNINFPNAASLGHLLRELFVEELT